MARRRDRWAEIVLRTALWMREAPQAVDLCWRELAIVAKALADGRDVSEIGLMRDIALRTIAVLGAAGADVSGYPPECQRRHARVAVKTS